jgi:predicted protein tyrosine phosphatase
MRLMVCPRSDVPQFKEAPVTHFVSLIDPDETQTPIALPKSTQERLLLAFHDLDDIEMNISKFRRYDPPSPEHVERIVAFGRRMAPLDDWGLLAHCEAGISRSSAAAITALAFGLVRRACPAMLPNRRILRLADEILDTGGVMHRMADNYRRKAFVRAGYEDPTNVLLAKEVEHQRGFWATLARFFRAMRFGQSRAIGTGAAMRGVNLAERGRRTPHRS